MATTDIVSPDGLDLSPEPPRTVRLSKRAGIAFLVAGAIVSGLILYGIVTRGNRQSKLGFASDQPKGVTAATDTGKVIAAEVPLRPTAEARDLIPPETEQRAGQTNPADRPASTPSATARTAPPYSQSPAPSMQFRELTPEEKRREVAFRNEQEAFNAPTMARGATSADWSGSRGSSAQTDMTQLSQLARGFQAGENERSGTTTGEAALAASKVLMGGATVSQSEEYRLQNAQEEKEAFLSRIEKDRRENYLAATRVKPLGKYEIKAGWDIPAILEQALNSDLPGEVKALVREHVYDTATGKYLLIPQGARLLGVYDSRVGYGQEGVQVVWNRIIFPDGSSVNLDGMVGQDANGFAGFRHDVDNHYRRLFGFAALTSMFSAAFQLSQQRHGTVFTYPSAREIAGSAAAGNMSQIGAEMTRRNMNIQPTIKVPIGYRFNVRVNRDLLFEAPYTPASL